MIPILYSSTEKDYTHNGIAPLKESIEATVTEEANGLLELYLEYPINGMWSREIKDQMLIKAKPNDLNEPHVFRIYEIVKNMEEQLLYIYASSKTNDLGLDLVQSATVTNGTGQEAMNVIKANLTQGTTLTLGSDIVTRSSTSWSMRNPLNCIVGEEGSIVQWWGGELKRNNDGLYLYARRGRDNVAVIRQGKNLEGFDMTVSTQGLITRILPHATVRNEETGEESEIIGSIVDSPRVGNYPVRRIVAVDYTDESITTLAQLNSAAASYFTDRNPDSDKPTVRFKIDMVQLSNTSYYAKFKKLESVGVFDTVTVYVPKFDVNVNVKIRSVEYDVLREKTIRIVAGDAVSDIFKDIRNDYTAIINDTTATLHTIIQQAANGNNRIWRGISTPVPPHKKGDLWYKPVGEHMVMLQWDGLTWVEILNTEDMESVKREVDAAIAEAEAAKQAAEQSYTDSVAEAERLVQAQTDAFNAQMTGVNQEISTVKSNINTAIANVNQEIANNFTSLSDSISEVDAIAAQAKTDAQTAKNDAQTAKNDAQTALSNASTALGQAQSAVSTAASANNKAIKSSVVDWALSSSGTTPPTSGWQTSVPTPSSTQYTWGRTTITLNDGTTILSYNVSKIGVKGDKGDAGAGGAKGDKGDAGADAPKITSVKQQFYLSTSNTTQTGGSWTETIPVWSSGKYYWTRVVTSYDNATTTPSVAVLDNALNQSLVTALEAKSDTQTLSTTVSQHATQIAAKASQTTVDTLTGRVSTAEGSISVQAGQIALKANQTTVDTLTGRVGTAETNISANTTAINLRATKSSVDTLTGRVTTAEGTITAQAGQIALRATTATVNALTGRVSTAEAAIVTQAGRIDLAATKTELTTAIDGIEVGGRNYFTQTTTFTQAGSNAAFIPRHPDTPNGFRVTGNSSSNGTVRIPKVITSNGWWTVSFDIRGSQSVAVGLTVDICDLGSTRVITNASNTYERRSVSVYVTNYTHDLYNFVDFGAISYAYFWVDNIKVEKGNKATDWSPAPEDVDKAISTVQSNLTVEAGKITALTTRVSGAETNISNVTQTVSGINTTISTLRTDVNGKATIVALNQVKSTADGNKTTISNHAGRLTTVETNVSGLQVSVADKVSTAQFTVLSNSVSSVIAQTNILVNPDFETDLSGWTVNGSVTREILSGGIKAIRMLPNAAGIWQQIDGSKTLGDVYTITFRAKTDSGKVASVHLGFLNLTSDYKKIQPLTSEWTDYSFTTSAPMSAGTTNNFHIYSLATNTGNIYISSISVIKGSAVTQSQITQISDLINLRVTKGDVVNQINISPESILIAGKRIQLDGDVTMTSAFTTRLDTQTLTAITANITSIRSKVLVTDSVTSTHIKAENALIDTIFGTTALISQLTSKTAFINNIKAITISADKVTTGTLNASNVNIINLNVSKIVGLNSSFIQSQWNSLDATTSITGTGLVSQQGTLSTRLTGGEIATVSGTKTGKINALGMEIYDSSNGQTTRLHSDGLEFNWYGIKRVLEQNSEGMTIRPITGSGNRLNSSLHITTGAGTDKVAYVEFTNPTSGYGGRIILQGMDMGVRHPAGGVVQIASYANDGRQGNLRAGTFQTSTYDGRGLRIVESQINTLANNQTIYIMPSGTGEVRIGAGGSNPPLWPVRASRFVEGSSRASKTNIHPYTGSAIAEIKNLQAVTFSRKEDVANGINYMSLGFIAEDSPFIAIRHPGAPLGVDHYKMVTLAIKGVQELTDITDKHASDILRVDTYVTQHELEIKKLKERIKQLEEKIA